jgi:hypothetical protein
VLNPDRDRIDIAAEAESDPIGRGNPLVMPQKVDIFETVSIFE